MVNSCSKYTCRFQNPDKPRAGRVGAAHGGGGGAAPGEDAPEGFQTGGF